MQEYDAAIIGGGVAGLNIASAASKLGWNVALIEKERLGGDCLWYGCVPSKTLIKSANVFHYITQAERYGITAKASISLADVTKHVQDTINTLKVHDSPERFRKMGVDVFFGSPKFVTNREITLNGTSIKARHVVISTGSAPITPDIPGLEKSGFITNLSVFTLTKLPKKLAVIGGGPIGTELAQAFNRLGSEVSVLLRGNKILKKEDEEISKELLKMLTDEGVRFFFNTSIEKIHAFKSKKMIHYTANGAKKKIECDQILVAIGQAPNVEGLDLEKAGVAYTGKGITVNARMQTSQKNIYACGDVVGNYQFTHMAEYEAGIVIANMIFKFPKKADYRVVPWVTFTDPEVARVGITEAEAKNLAHRVITFPFSKIDRAITDAEAKGFVKLIINKKGRVLGCTILGPHAGELIHEFVLAMKANIPISQISQSIHAYPTLAQIARRAVNIYYGERLFSEKTKKFVRFLKRVFR